ncbi:3-methyl-2-oxobutanoate hydroxymethyltransferase [Lujinxingia litoralis]|uniref:3-methyl-2-oxobutanoate hydroxymethyltransferase n=1 Tax=Lujinxingia litoralis TaxID=2211119 RepID=A0A328C704_9DELT|nr:3-methyl-2-oxobutanoate hydroxymethyltransferase [Lujinxingia litoralis]RAL22234.1 3-methyl-2-oxobutanoate hydroxymethyltransferase [Lujinxingia litoralis]
MARRKTTRALRKLYEKQTPLTMVTCYDYTFARLVDKADIDIILVGDSMGNVIQGHDTTVPVTLEDIIYHTRAVLRGNQSAHILADMPFMSYQASTDDALRNAGRLLKEGHAQSVKVEGGEELATMIARMTAAGIPVCGHLGLTPQSVHAFGGFRLQGTDDEAAERLLKDARALQDAGAFMIVLEMVPAALAKRVTNALDIPTIGIGAGPHTSGQVLVLQDMLGMNSDFKPRFVKHFASLENTVVGALNAFADEVHQRSFPDDEHSY